MIPGLRLDTPGGSLNNFRIRYGPSAYNVWADPRTLSNVVLTCDILV